VAPTGLAARQRGCRRGDGDHDDRRGELADREAPATSAGGVAGRNPVAAAAATTSTRRKAVYGFVALVQAKWTDDNIGPDIANTPPGTAPVRHPVATGPPSRGRLQQPERRVTVAQDTTVTFGLPGRITSALAAVAG
jgi:hypothetical protein